MKKVLYLMPIDWAWIAQRPHFLALELMKKYQVEVAYLKQYIKRWKSQKAIETPKKCHCGIYIPFQEKIGMFAKFSDWSMRKAIGDINVYDIVYVGSPLMYKYVENFKGIVVYDCMDNYVALEKDEQQKHIIKEYEKKVIEAADLILVSSLKLEEHIKNKKENANVLLVRNGYNSTTIYPIKKSKCREKYKLGYIGTVSSWMNFSVLERCVEKHGDIEVHLIGPAAGYDHQTTKGIVFDGIVEHTQLYSYIEEFDCLMMPFVLNDIILAVDPVKLYEYINFGKCIISVYYKEIERFSDFVYFYKDENEFVQLVDYLKTKGFPAKYTEKQQREFLENNSWEVRGKLINESIECLWN